MAQKLLRNWAAISSIRCAITRAALASCRDPFVLDSLAKAFPACFRKGNEEETDKIAWSRILRAAEQGYANSLSDGPSEHALPGRDHYWHKYIWEDAAKGYEDLLSLPIVATWFRSSNLDYARSSHESDGALPPAAVMKQLVEHQKNGTQGPLFVSLNGIHCVVGWLYCDNKFSTLDKLDLSTIQDLALINASAIEFDC